ncbi:hypothetical protein A4H97_14995 [Niastella yeongjuensis]|uniref:GYF domain-containing protein n=1 Tax=Niastella yeongjuensis TaxID=354355 RepID=A0A1V9E462_9BACT|nr:DUF4339 domain-containing protein [Niastella yeongjuensis]OQP40910.1 hypothetical protein A4H97_14995 [Niastella yeongjuensis]SEO98116.1 hypothetical protein SAMN05660816_04051 [Niastella yeongjuensis]
MNQYLLLRDNKQTGPYSAQELAAKGLKPYDLVWLEGKSAAWRYPGELEELKAFAPVMEGTETSLQAVAETVPEAQPVSKQVEQTSKHIYVTMPKGKAQTASTPVAKKEETAKAVSSQNDKNANTANNTQKKAAATTYLISEEDDELNSALLKGHKSRKQEDDQINSGFMNDYESRKAAWSKNNSGGSAVKAVEKPIEKAASQPKKETWAGPKKDQFDLKTLLAGSSQYLQNNKNLTRVLVAVVLILGGVVIGLVINSGHKQPDTRALESLVKEIRDKQNEKTTSTPRTGDVAQKSKESRHTAEREHVYNNDHVNSDPEPASTSGSNENPANRPGGRHAVIKKDNSVVTPPPPPTKSITVPISPTTQTVETSPTNMEPKEKGIDKEVIEKARKNIYEQVHVEASAFKVGLLGGVSDLDITVQNTSLYALDQVAVEVRYFGPEKKLVKTQTLLFNSIPPGKRRTVEAPSTRRGITIEYGVISINSKALGLAQSGF